MNKLISAALCLIWATTVQAAPRTFTFDGQTLSEHRRGFDKGDAFAEFTRQQDGAREMLLIRSIVAGRVQEQAKLAIADIRSHHPSVRLRVLEKSGGNDLMISYLLTPDKGDPSLVIWRLSQSGPGLMVVIYQLDFSLDDEDAKERVTKHSAELALSRLDPAELKQLLPAAN